MLTMTWQVVVAVVTITILTQLRGHDCYYWSSSLTDGAVKHACVGDDVTFPWKITLSPEEQLVTIQWTFQGGSNEIIAMLHSGRFLPMPAFSQRVRQEVEQGILLSHVTAGDSGNYTVVVTAHDSSGNIFTIRHRAELRVTEDHLVSGDGNLHVTQEPLAVRSNDTNHWSVELTCGNFGHHGRPAFDVEWVLPSGAVVPSSHFDKGAFHLLVANPVTGGSYRCRLPAANRCASGNGGNGQEASVWVEEVTARLTVLEAEQGALVADTDRLKVEMDLATESSATPAGGSPPPKVAANNVAAETHRSDQTSPLDSQLLTALQTLERETNQTNGQLLAQNILLYKQVHDLEQQMDESMDNQSAMTEENERLRQQMQSLQNQNAELVTRQQTFEAKMTKVTFDLVENMNEIVQENSVMNQLLQALGHQMNASQTSSTDQEHSEIAQRVCPCQNQIDRLQQRLQLLESVSNTTTEFNANPPSHVVDMESRLNQSVTQLSQRLALSTTQLSVRMQHDEYQIQDLSSQLNAAEKQLRSFTSQLSDPMNQLPNVTTQSAGFDNQLNQALQLTQSILQNYDKELEELAATQNTPVLTRTERGDREELKRQLDIVEKLMGRTSENSLRQSLAVEALRFRVGLLALSMAGINRMIFPYIGRLALPERSCVDTLTQYPDSGVVTIKPSGHLSLDVYCDQKTDGGGWAVFHRRVAGSTAIPLHLEDYKHGFGNMSDAFWLGLEDLHTLTSTQTCELRVDLVDRDGNALFATYNAFSISDSTDGYRLHLGNYTGGTAGDGLSRRPGYLSVLGFGNDDIQALDCAGTHPVTWWLSNSECFLFPSTAARLHQSMQWKDSSDNVRYLQRVEMKIRPQ